MKRLEEGRDKNVKNKEKGAQVNYSAKIKIDKDLCSIILTVTMFVITTTKWKQPKGLSTEQRQNKYGIDLKCTYLSQ